MTEYAKAINTEDGEHVTLISETGIVIEHALIVVKEPLIYAFEY